ncbi:GspH/FimT family pseudopilin [Pseudomonas solani]|uniref:GspH/FimT family pseudopilin n=1 Tax=Pseudomonas solani TaxID=2731552 RepID=UPI003C2AFF3E
MDLLATSARFSVFRLPFAGKDRPAQTGFSLIELMVVVALLSLFAGIALPSFGTLIQSNRVESSAFSVFRVLQLARSDAVTTRSPQTLCQNGSAAEWLLVRAADCSSLATSVVSQQLSLPSSLTVTSTVSSVPFRSDGTATAMTLTLSSKRTSSFYTVRVAGSGFITMAAGNSP